MIANIKELLEQATETINKVNELVNRPRVRNYSKISLGPEWNIDFLTHNFKVKPLEYTILRLRLRFFENCTPEEIAEHLIQMETDFCNKFVGFKPTLLSVDGKYSYDEESHSLIQQVRCIDFTSHDRLTYMYTIQHKFEWPPGKDNDDIIIEHINAMGSTVAPRVVFKFPQGTIVRHVKTQSLYKIFITPDMVRLEHSNKPAYLYAPTVQEPMEVLYWVRDQEEMEDGRFELVDE